jgi:hypothetical protein
MLRRSLRRGEGIEEEMKRSRREICLPLGRRCSCRPQAQGVERVEGTRRGRFTVSFEGRMQGCRPQAGRPEDEERSPIASQRSRRRHWPGGPWSHAPPAGSAQNSDQLLRPSPKGRSQEQRGTHPRSRSKRWGLPPQARLLAPHPLPAPISSYRLLHNARRKPPTKFPYLSYAFTYSSECCIACDASSFVLCMQQVALGRPSRTRGPHKEPPNETT